MNTFITTLFFLIVLVMPRARLFAQATPATEEHKASLASLTQSERGEFLTAHQKALMDPAVQSTRKIARMALHKAMLQADPSIETIIANMDARGPQSGLGSSSKRKSLGGNFQQWLANFPLAATATLTPEEREKLKAAHEKAMQDPSVQEARKIAYLTFYNAIINADSLIGPILTKAGIATPKSVVPLSKNSNIGSEEKILGGDFQAWDEEVLAPAVKSEEKPPSFGAPQPNSN